MVVPVGNIHLSGSACFCTPSTCRNRGLYYTDCSCYISWLLHSSGLSEALSEIPVDPHPDVRPPAPRARSFHSFLSSINDNNNNPYWESVGRVQDISPGDIVSWSVPGIGDTTTGHVMVSIPSPTSGCAVERYNSTAYWVYVSDASSLRHDSDSRCVFNRDMDGSPTYECRRGVGRGRILVSVFEDQEAGTAKAFQFRLDSTPRYYHISIGRLRRNTEPKRRVVPLDILDQSINIYK